MTILNAILLIVQTLSAVAELSISLFDRWKQRKKEDKPP
jgi:hypothetical protein